VWIQTLATVAWKQSHLYILVSLYGLISVGSVKGDSAIVG